MHIAFFSPFSPLQTALADHAEGLLPHLAEHADIDVFIDGGYQPSNPAIRKSFPIYSYNQFAARQTTQPYDIVVYNMGDQPDFHGYMYPILLQHPGIVILNDVVLQHLVLGMTLHKGDVNGYIAEMRYAYGDEGVKMAERIIAGQGDDILYDYPLVERVLDASLGVLIQNRCAQSEVLRRRPGLNVANIPYLFYLPADIPSDFDGTALRAQLGLTDRFVVASFGFFIPDKRLELVLRAFARFHRTHPEAIYLLVGGHSSYYDLPGYLRSLGLEDDVILTGWLDVVSFARHMFVADLAIHLRYPHVGGTPYTPIRLMGLGRPTIISDIGPLAEIPADCCARVAVDEDEEEVLLATMEYLADHPGVRRQMGENARRYIREHHDPRRVAEAYIAFIKEVQTRPAPPPSPRAGVRAYDQDLIREVATMLAEWGVSGDDKALLRPVAKALAGLELFRALGKRPRD